MTLETTLLGGDAAAATTAVDEKTETKTEDNAAVTEETKTTTETSTEEAAPSPEEASEAGRTLSNRKKSFQSRIDELTFKTREAERREAKALAELARLKASAKPDAAKFDDQAEYTAATVDHSLNQRDAKRLEESLTNDRSERTQAIAEAFQLRIADFKEGNPEAAKDFEDVAYSSPIGESTSEIVATLEEGPAVAYYLGKHPAEAASINRLPEREKAAALGRIAGRLTAPVTRKTTSAPSPVNAVLGRSSGSSPDLNKVSQADFEKQWGKLEKG